MTTLLDQTMPRYEFREKHQRRIDASAEKVWQVLTKLTLDQLSITRPLVAIRHLGVNAAIPTKPLFTDGPVRMLEIDAPNYAVGGVVGRPWQYRAPHHEVASLEEFVSFDEPGWTKYLTDFQIEPLDGAVLLSTETRGYSTDRRAKHRFVVYWSFIRPGSGLVRRDILATVARRAANDSRM